MNRVRAVIPVHLHSARVPGKALIDLDGKPLLWHVWQQVVRSEQFLSVTIATDSAEVVSVAQSWGASLIESPPGASCGTDRIASVLDQLDADYVVNIQADMPRIDAKVFVRLCEQAKTYPHSVVTPIYRIMEPATLGDVNRVKAVVDDDGRALYFSRQAIPFVRDLPAERWLDNHVFYGHVGIYGYSTAVLTRYRELPPSPLEVAEKLEQLRFLAAGIPIHTVSVDCPPSSIDSLADLEKFKHNGSPFAASVKT